MAGVEERTWPVAESKKKFTVAIVGSAFSNTNPVVGNSLSEKIFGKKISA
jgi:hypothetical protein